MAILTKACNQKLAYKIVQYDERPSLFCALGCRTPALDPWGHAPIQIHQVAFSAVGAEPEIVVRKGPVDLAEKRLRHIKGAAFLAALHVDRPDLLLAKDPEKIPRAELMPQFRCVLGARVHAGSATDTLVVGIIENPEGAFIGRFERACGAT